MWYQELLKVLISKINNAEQKNTEAFLTLLFKKITKSSGGLIPPLVLFGLIDKMYKKYGSLEEGSVPLKSFARDITGLSLILVKAASDSPVWNKDFSLKHRVILSALGLSTPRAGFKPRTRGLKSKIYEDDGWSDDELPDTIEKVPDFKSKIIFLETKIYEAWDYDLTVDFDTLLSIILNSHPAIAPAVLAYCKQGYTSLSEDFDEFICKLRLMLLAREYIEQGNLYELQLLLHPDSEEILEALTSICQETLKPHIRRSYFESVKIQTHFLKVIGENLQKRATPFVTKIIDRYLNDNETIKDLLQFALEHDQPKIVSYLREKTLLINIVDTLINNIETKSGGRWTSGINSEKVEALKAIQAKIEADKGFSIDDSVVQPNYKQEIMEACQIKRNPWHFWAIPNSVTEFKHLLEENMLDLPTTDNRTNDIFFTHKG